MQSLMSDEERNAADARAAAQRSGGSGGGRGKIAQIAFAVIAALAVIVLFVNILGRPDPVSVEYQGEVVTIRCRETGDEWTMVRGEMERNLLMRRGDLTPDEGLPSPSNGGKLTGFPVSEREWLDTVSRINGEKEIVRSIQGG